MFRKIALSIEFDDLKAIENLDRVFNIVNNITQIRVIQVVGANMTPDDCLTYIKKLQEIGVKQITFRQMFGNKKAYQNFNYLNNNIPPKEGVMFLKDGEYHNYYFTNNNTLYPYFFGHTKEDRLKWMRIYEDIEQSCN